MSAWCRGLILCACLALPMLAHAAASCTARAVNVAFGDYDVFTTTGTSSTGSVTVSCQGNASYTITLSAGSGTFASRVMASGSHKLDYNLFTDTTHLTIWGDGTSGTRIVSGNGKGATYTVYGLIPALQNVPAGSYSDTITVTVTY